MNVLEALALGLVQGLAEWLPVSSSGHLVILQNAMGLQVPILFDVLLHVATAFVAAVFLRAEVVEIFRSLARSLKRWRAGERFSRILKEEEGSLTAWLIVVACVPTAIVGIMLEWAMAPLFQSLLTVGISLIATGVILSFTAFVHRNGGRALNTAGALIIGSVQGAAILPGLSRSGTTISFGLYLGGERVRVAKYSFLLAIPAILGGAMVEGLRMGWASLSVDALSLAVAIVSTLVLGFVALKLLFIIISKARFYLFAPYCIILGTALIALYVF